MKAVRGLCMVVVAILVFAYIPATTLVAASLADITSDPIPYDMVIPDGVLIVNDVAPDSGLLTAKQVLDGLRKHEFDLNGFPPDTVTITRLIHETNQWRALFFGGDATDYPGDLANSNWQPHFVYEVVLNDQTGEGGLYSEGNGYTGGHFPPLKKLMRPPLTGSGPSTPKVSVIKTGRYQEQQWDVPPERTILHIDEARDKAIKAAKQVVLGKVFEGEFYLRGLFLTKAARVGHFIRDFRIKSVTPDRQQWVAVFVGYSAWKFRDSSKRARDRVRMLVVSVDAKTGKLMASVMGNGLLNDPSILNEWPGSGGPAPDKPKDPGMKIDTDFAPIYPGSTVSITSDTPRWSGHTVSLYVTPGEEQLAVAYDNKLPPCAVKLGETHIDHGAWRFSWKVDTPFLARKLEFGYLYVVAISDTGHYNYLGLEIEPKRTLTVAPDRIVVGQSMAIDGKEYPANTELRLIFENDRQDSNGVTTVYQIIDTIHSDARGCFSYTWTIPAHVNERTANDKEDRWVPVTPGNYDVAVVEMNELRHSSVRRLEVTK